MEEESESEVALAESLSSMAVPTIFSPSSSEEEVGSTSPSKPPGPNTL